VNEQTSDGLKALKPEAKGTVTNPILFKSIILNTVLLLNFKLRENKEFAFKALFR